ncbi:MAG: helix-turn-helix transcriptional regulator [Clostridiales bacterium]|nr:helix-turn-helix transcriptional regulator [Clostridiales bacterium]
MNYFAENIKTLRKEKNLTQPELAKALHVSNGMISFWENGKYEPTATNIIIVANYFNISIDELLLTEL